MKKKVARWIPTLLILCMLCITNVYPIQAFVSPPIYNEKKLDEQLHTWIKQIIQDKQFLAWEHSKWEVKSLGANTHMWIVHIRHQDKDIGYMILAANEQNQYTLMEYGNGEHAMFSQHSLEGTLSNIQYDTPAANTFKPWYLDPFHALWVADIKDASPMIFDGKTPDRYQHIEKNWEQFKVTTSHVEEPWNVIHEVTQLEQIKDGIYQDPYENIQWMLEEPQQLQDLEQIQSMIQEKKVLLCKIKILTGNVNAPLSITGYHQWDNETYLEVEQFGSRFIPFSLLQAYDPEYYIVDSSADQQ
ncbi:hypothetical protein [Longirhabdus pacifica]|uniref:hypothetical protein n=1 Tax=Longirhabdus pacifica TaxID=2305227 RepID=UPI001008B487|nr:hypothetical protein [Longirhabdus pacifica]